MASQPSGFDRPAGTLTRSQLYDVAVQVSQGNVVAGGPVEALCEGLKLVGWKISGFRCMVTCHHGIIGLTMGSPAMLKAIYRVEYDMLRCRRARDIIQPKWDRPIAFGRINSLGSLLRNRKVNGSTKVAIMELMCGTSPSPARMRSHGWACRPGCPCGYVAAARVRGLRCPTATSGLSFSTATTRVSFSTATTRVRCPTATTRVSCPTDKRSVRLSNATSRARVTTAPSSSSVLTTNSCGHISTDKLRHGYTQ